MKQATIAFLTLLFAGVAGQAQETKVKTETDQGAKMKMKQKGDKVKMKGDMAMQQMDLPYTVSYSSQFVPGNPDHAKMVLNLYRAYEKNDMSGESPFSDTATVILSDGQVLKGREAISNAFAQARSSFANIAFTISAVTSVHSVDRNTDWVLLWGSEAVTAANSTTAETSEFHTIWLVNKNNQIDYVEFFQGKTPMRQ